METVQRTVGRGISSRDLTASGKIQINFVSIKIILAILCNNSICLIDDFIVGEWFKKIYCVWHI